MDKKPEEFWLEVMWDSFETLQCLDTICGG